MKRLLMIVAVLGVVSVPAMGNHAGCLASTAAPVCTYTAAGPHSWAAATPNAFQIWVTRNGQKVVLADRAADVTQAVAGGLDAVGANAGELVTIEMIPDAQGYVIGAVSSGNTSGHP